MSEVFPPWAVSGNNVPGAFSWVVPGGKALSLLKGSTVVVESWTLPDLPLTLLSNWFWISAGVKFVFQKANYAACVISRML